MGSLATKSQPNSTLGHEIGTAGFLEFTSMILPEKIAGLLYSIPWQVAHPIEPDISSPGGLFPFSTLTSTHIPHPRAWLSNFQGVLVRITGSNTQTHRDIEDIEGWIPGGYDR
jgi:hypothetical protein